MRSWSQLRVKLSSAYSMPKLTVLGKLKPGDLVYRVDPKKAHTCVIARVLSHCASKSAHRSLQYASPGKI